MQCDICLRSSSSRLPFNCASCARNVLYENRIQLTQTILESEAFGKEVESNITVKPPLGQNKASTNTKSPECSPAWAFEQAISERVASAERTRKILSHVEALRRETENVRIEIAKRKASVLRRRSNIKSATSAFQRESGVLDTVEQSVRRIEHRRDVLHNKTRESRIFLCQETAQLHGLEQRQRRRGGAARNVYLIGGVPIIDLRELNNASPAQVTASNTNLAHLVHLVSHYLAVRLPAEITLSHRDYPLPTIFSPSSSYTSRDVPFPGTTPSHSSNNSPSASRTADQRILPGPRPLYLDRKLSVLYKEDPATYALFVEGISYLAWDIAWVCKTQGLHLGANTWEDVCAMGKNLWQLLVSPTMPYASRSPTPIPRTRPSQDSLSTAALSRTATHTRSNPPETHRPQSAMLGHFSHGTAHSFLEASDGTEYMRNWRLQDPLKVIDNVIMMLSNERAGAEWEILEGNEWEEEGSPGKEGDGKGIGTKRWSRFKS